MLPGVLLIEEEEDLVCTGSPCLVLAKMSATRVSVLTSFMGGVDLKISPRSYIIMTRTEMAVKTTAVIVAAWMVDRMLHETKRFMMQGRYISLLEGVHSREAT
jgi:hypothetical protein